MVLGMRGVGTVERWGRAAVAGCLALLLAGCAGPAAGSDPPGPPAPPAAAAAPPPPPAAAAAPPTQAGPTQAGPTQPGPPLRVLQLNLCSSGIAGCYTGRSTAEAAAVVRAEAPDVVTVNEACEDDLVVLRDALDEVAPGGGATASFQAARDRRTGEGYRCRNGRQYGIGLVTRSPSAGGSEGIHPVQDPVDPEERAWLCRDVAGPPALVACTTHLAYTVREVAVAQCAHLSRTVVPELRTRSGGAPAVVGADLNLGSDGPDLDSCLPPGHTRAGDGGPQHVVATPGLTVADSRTIDLRGSTDHPALLVTLERESG